MNENLSGGRKIGSAKLESPVTTDIYTQLASYIRQGGEPEPCPDVLGVTLRTYKVSRRFTPRRYDNTETPFIRLTGEWLAAAGFPIAGKLKAEVSQGRIILTAVSHT
jgi:hypothetical protein